MSKEQYTTRARNLAMNPTPMSIRHALQDAYEYGFNECVCEAIDLIDGMKVQDNCRVQLDHALTQVIDKVKLLNVPSEEVKP